MLTVAVALVVVVALVLVDLAILGLGIAAVLALDAIVWFSGGAPVVAAIVWLAAAGWLAWTLYRHRHKIAARATAIRKGKVELLLGDKIIQIGGAIFVTLFFIASQFS